MMVCFWSCAVWLTTNISLMSRKLNFHLIRQTNLLPAGFSVSHMSYCRRDIICHFSTVASLSLTHNAFPFLNYWFKSKRYSVPRPSPGLCFFRVAWSVSFFLMVYVLPQFWLTKTWTSQIEVFITIRKCTQVHLTIHLTLSIYDYKPFGCISDNFGESHISVKADYIHISFPFQN